MALSGTRRIIGLTGFKGSGKTTIADAMDGWTRLSFADGVRRVAQAAWGLTSQQMQSRELKESPDPFWGDTPRSILQKIGIMFRENVGKGFWINAIDKRIRNMEEQTDGVTCVVLDDVRFPNEAEWVKSQGVVVGLNRPGVTLDSDHPSETEMAEHWSEMVDVEVKNDSSPEVVAAHVIESAKEVT